MKHKFLLAKNVEILFIAAGFAVALAGASSTAVADPRIQFGWGLHDMALAGSDRTGSDDAMSVVQNPATMTDQAETMVSANLLGMSFNFPTLNNVVTDSPNFGATSSTTGNVNLNPDPIYLFQAGISTPFGKNNKYSFGFALSMPVDRLVDVETKDGYRPSMAFYGKPESRLTSVFGIARKLGDHVSFGIGGQSYFKTGATLNVRLPQSPTTSTLSFGATVRLAVALVTGFNFKFSDSTDLGISYIGARDYRQEVSATNLLYLLGTGAVLQLNTSGSNYYDPEIWSMGFKYTFNAGGSESARENTLTPAQLSQAARIARTRTQLLYGMDFERWSPYDGTVAKITFTSFTSQFAQSPNNLAFRDIVVPRVGVVFGDSVRARFGYAYRPSPLVDLNGSTNEIDSDHHVIAAGASFSIGTLGLFDSPIQMDLGAQVHLFVPRAVTKSDPNGLGYPGYTVNGQAYFYGLGLSRDI